MEFRIDTELVRFSVIEWWKAAVNVGSSEWESTHRGAARSAGFRNVGGYRGANRRVAGPQTDANRRIAGPQTGGNRRGSAPRAAGGFGALVGGPADIATDVSIVTKPCAAILDGPYSIARLDGTSHPHHARRRHLAGARRSYWGRGRPESLPRPSRYLHRLWRCRPARPPTPRNPPLRAAPIRADPHPVDPTLTVVSHPVAPTKTVVPHPDTHQRHATPPCAPPRDAPILTPPLPAPTLTTPSRLTAALSNEL
jgi:hypothetical protein